ncbi:uncharacterized protein B0P05DRAFT_545003 [Gilbertella persicaria]|uniref:uncharacterized protein n=1 Tax=Gilbertella persicaria TaxID=101096 RepID=UPI0022212777|nr:uncharacterized protein B0P05DRAFT_545003 [Gilbertella persicaria]KAI8076581.1 hypothetical protein B0P05DRAFT_545003 [Gilbertella persicaria]
MMLFQRNTDSGSIRNFYVSTGSSGQEKPVAYGPGSIINGSLMITLDKPLPAYNIRVIFKCEELDSSKKENTTIFAVDSVIWGHARKDSKMCQLESQELASGSHMYLFAIRLPQVNYPPSMHVSHFGHRINYTLQGVIELVSEGPHYTSTLPIIYLPLVTTSVTHVSRKTQVYQKNQDRIEITAELIKPAYCPGDLCTLKMMTKNKSDIKITQVQIQFNAIATTLAPTSAVEYIHKQQTLLTETFYVSIAKHTTDHQDVFQFIIPSHLVPTFTNKMGRYIDIAYEVVLIVPLNPTSTGLFGTQSITNTISLPMIIATVPPAYPIDIQVHEPLQEELPFFIPNIESPMPSPVTYPADRAYSVSPSNSFQMMFNDDDDVMIDDDFALSSHISDASGHLLVPDSTRRKSSSS